MKHFFRKLFSQISRAKIQRDLSEVQGKAAAKASNELADLADTSKTIKFGLYAMVLGFGGFLLWASFAPLDEGVPSQGTVVLETKRKVVQHLQGGIIKEVRVKEGDQVTEGQLLIKLNDGSVRANYESTRQQYYSLRISEDRLISEQLGAAEIEFDSDLLKAATHDPSIRKHLALQRALFQSKIRQVSLLQKELYAIQELVKEGFATQTRQMELERQVIDYRKEVEKELSSIRPELQAVTEKFKAIQEELARTEIRAPASGQVVGLVAQTVGGVITGGQRIMDIVPGKEELVIEAQIQPHLIDRVKAGDVVDIRFYTFPNTPQLVIEGLLETISLDVLSDPNSQHSYYLGRVVVTPSGMQTLGSRRLQPGMPAEIVVKTGSRTLMQYILHPLIKRVASSMKEE